VTRDGGDIVGPIPDGRDPDEYDRLRRRVLWSLPLGLYVLGSRAGSRRNLMTVSWVTQVAQEPKLVGVGVESKAYTHELLVEGGVFALSLLTRRHRALVRQFVKPVRDIDVDEDSGVGTMNTVSVRGGSTGAPVLDVATAWLECEIRHTLALGSHSWFVGEVVDAGATTGAVPEAGAVAGTGDDDDGILRMEDTRMNYGG
jgi:flavin reductase (DIM6/NTAB) family NADH-FMN oxidoreductase RutF